MFEAIKQGVLNAGLYLVQDLKKDINNIRLDQMNPTERGKYSWPIIGFLDEREIGLKGRLETVINQRIETIGRATEEYIRQMSPLVIASENSFSQHFSENLKYVKNKASHQIDTLKKKILELN